MALDTGRYGTTEHDIQGIGHIQVSHLNLCFSISILTLPRFGLVWAGHILEIQPPTREILT